MEEKEMDNCTLRNFTWQVPNWIATGGEPLYRDEIIWLVKNGFGAIASLVRIDDLIADKIKSCNLGWFFCEIPLDLDEVKPGDELKFQRFVQSQIDAGRKVYVHCSGGYKRSVKMVERIQPTLTLPPT